jgi:hypothetical protein
MVVELLSDPLVRVELRFGAFDRLDNGTEGGRTEDELPKVLSLAAVDVIVGLKQAAVPLPESNL